MHQESEVSFPQALSLYLTSPHGMWKPAPAQTGLGLNKLSASFWGSGGRPVYLSFYSAFPLEFFQE